jgi:hypothetical protein
MGDDRDTFENHVHFISQFNNNRQPIANQQDAIAYMMEIDMEMIWHP